MFTKQAREYKMTKEPMKGKGKGKDKGLVW